MRKDIHMKFLGQVKVEIVNILRSKFLLITGIIVLLAAVAIPVIQVISPPKNEGGYYPGPIMYARAASYDYDIKGPIEPGMPDQEPITIDGVVITSDNPSYWALNGILQQQQMIEDGNMTFNNEGTAAIMLDMYDLQLDYYLHFAVHVTDYNDYRMELQWMGMNHLGEKYIYEHNDKDPASLFEASQYLGVYYETQEKFNEKFIGIPSEEKLAAIDAADEYLNKMYDIIDNDNFAAYIDISIAQQQDYIDNNNEQIEMLEKDLLDHPDQEEYINQQIESLLQQNEITEKNTIPMLQYRLEKNIRPNTDTWQNVAISDLQQAQNYLLTFKIIPESDFNKPDYQYLKDQYGTYQRYVAQMSAEKFEKQNIEIVSKSSLDAEKPDMKYVQNGARSETVKSLLFSAIVALFAVLLGGWIMGSEFQFGTIRLLLIRPKTRIKIMMAKFLAALILCLGLYLAGTLLNIVANGICFGFSDFSFPNYTVAGEVGFFGFYISEMLACAVPIIFGLCVAFMLSMVIKNIAVSISIPVICFVGCYLLTDSLKSARIMDWIAYTPIPYVQLYAFFTPYNTTYTPFTVPVEPPAVIQLMQRGMPLSTTYGIIMMLALSVVCMVISILAFRKRDITN